MGSNRMGALDGATGDNGEVVTHAHPSVASDIASFLRCLIETPVGGLSREELIDQIAALERLKNGVAARQARLAVVFEATERQAQAAAGVPTRRQGQGVAAQLALARRESPTRAAAFLARSRTLCVDLPGTMTAFVAGELSEYRAGLVASEVALLNPAGRAEVDVELCGAAVQAEAVADALTAIRSGALAGCALVGMSDRAVRAAAAAAAYRVDPTVPLRRGRHAESERYVSLRPAPDAMTVLSAYLPVRQGVACLAGLRRVADAARAAGDPRNRAQVMADTLIARLTGCEQAGELPVELQLILTDEALLAEVFADPDSAETSAAETAATVAPSKTDVPSEAAQTPKTAEPPETPKTGEDVEAPVEHNGVPAGAGSATLFDPPAAAAPGEAVVKAADRAARPDRAVRPDRDERPAAAPGDQADTAAMKAGTGAARAERGTGLVARPHGTQPTDNLPTDDQPTDDVPCTGDVPRADMRGYVPRECGRAPAYLVGYGPVPAATARSWLRESLDAGGRTWLRRLLTDPISGQAVAIDARARSFPPALRRLILARDRHCRTPFCGAPIRHVDHATPHAAGGATDVANGQGLCERCNQAKTAPGWTAATVPDPSGQGGHVVATTTPTGHTYTSTAPALRPGPSLSTPTREPTQEAPTRGTAWPAA